MDKKTFEQLIKDGVVTAVGLMSNGEYTGDPEKIDDYAKDYVNQVGVVEIDNGEVVLTPEYKENHGGGGSEVTISFEEPVSLERGLSNSINYTLTGAEFAILEIANWDAYPNCPYFDIIDGERIYMTLIESGQNSTSLICPAEFSPDQASLIFNVRDYNTREILIQDIELNITVSDPVPYIFDGDLLTNLHDNFEIMTGYENNISGTLDIYDRAGQKVPNAKIMFEFDDTILFINEYSEGYIMQNEEWLDLNDLYPSFRIQANNAGEGTLVIHGLVYDSESGETIETLQPLTYAYTAVQPKQLPNLTFDTTTSPVFLNSKYRISYGNASSGEYGDSECKFYVRKKGSLGNWANFKFYFGGVELDNDADDPGKYEIFTGTVSDCINRISNDEAFDTRFEYELMEKHTAPSGEDPIYGFDVILEVFDNGHTFTVNCLSADLYSSTIYDNVAESYFDTNPTPLHGSTGDSDVDFSIIPHLSKEDYYVLKYWWSPQPYFTISFTEGACITYNGNQLTSGDHINIDTDNYLDWLQPKYFTLVGTSSDVIPEGAITIDVNYTGEEENVSIHSEIPFSITAESGA